MLAMKDQKIETTDISLSSAAISYGRKNKDFAHAASHYAEELREANTQIGQSMKTPVGALHASSITKPYEEVSDDKHEKNLMEDYGTAIAGQDDFYRAEYFARAAISVLKMVHAKQAQSELLPTDISDTTGLARTLNYQCDILNVLLQSRVQHNSEQKPLTHTDRMELQKQLDTATKSASTHFSAITERIKSYDSPSLDSNARDMLKFATMLSEKSERMLRHFQTSSHDKHTNAPLKRR